MESYSPEIQGFVAVASFALSLSAMALLCMLAEKVEKMRVRTEIIKRRK